MNKHTVCLLSVYAKLSGIQPPSYPVIYWETTKLGDVFCPFHQQEELLLHGLKHIFNAGCLRGVDVVTPR